MKNKGGLKAMISITSADKTRKSVVLFILLFLGLMNPSHITALVYPEIELKIFQFPSNMIPRIDGKAEDWNVVPEEYIYGIDMLREGFSKDFFLGFLIDVLIHYLNELK